MKKRNLIIVLGIVLVSIFISGCFTYVSTGFGIFDHPHHRYPAYCYDCHPRPHWARVYVDCRFYEFNFDDDGYWYIPRHGAKKVYVFKEYDYRIDKERKDYYKHRWMKEEQREKIQSPEKGKRRR